MFEQYYLNEDGEKVYFHEEHGMRFEWMKAEDINFIKRSNAAQSPLEVMSELSDSKILGFSIRKSSDYISKAVTKLVINNNGIIIVASTAISFIRHGYNGRVYYTYYNIRYYVNLYINNINKKYGYEKFSFHSVKSFNSKIPSRTKLNITCNDCGDIKQPTITDLATEKIGCQTCTKKTLVEFIQNSNKKHNGKYDYSLYNYISTQTESVIICPEHGEFNQTPNSHLSGSGCPSCSEKGFKPSLPARFYIHRDYSNIAYKAGITNNTINSRISPQNLSYKKIYNIDKFWNNEISIFFNKPNGGILARKLEIMIHRIAKCGNSNKNNGYYKQGDGYTETFHSVYIENVHTAIIKFLSIHEGEYIIEKDTLGLFGEVIM